VTRLIKSKKGFTLVELIVVIAIIGVLAGILIPTMIEYSRSSRVSSMNQTAASLKREISNWLTEANAKYYSLDINIVTSFKIDISAAGVFTDDPAASFAACILDPSAHLNYITELEDELGEHFAGIRESHVLVQYANGSVVGVLYTTDPVPSVSWNGSAWIDSGSRKDGVASNGALFGSYPQHRA